MIPRKAAQIRKSFQRPKFWVLGFGWCLAACAGAANVIAFKSWHLYASHVTGSTSAMAFRLEGYHQGEYGSESLKEACFLVLSFVLGAYACGLLIDKNQVHFLGKAFYGLALVLNSTLLVLAAFLPGRLLPVCFVSAACGLQNAMCTSHFGAIIRTTHVTGTVTDIGSTLGRISMIYLRSMVDLVGPVLGGSFTRVYPPMDWQPGKWDSLKKKLFVGKKLSPKSGHPSIPCILDGPPCSG